MHIFAITGLARSGKDTAAEYISRKFGFQWFDFSRDVLLEELKARKQTVTKENMSLLGDELRKKYGEDALAQRLVLKIKSSGAENAVVSGVRSPKEALCLKKNADKYVLIKIVADPKKRISRSGDAGINARDERDIKNKGLLDVLDAADITVENNGTLEELYKKIDAVIFQFGSNNPQLCCDSQTEKDRKLPVRS